MMKESLSKSRSRSGSRSRSRSGSRKLSRSRSGSRKSSRSRSGSRSGSRKLSRSRSRSRSKSSVTDEYIEYKFSDTKRKLGVKFKDNYPLVMDIDKDSYAEELDILKDHELTKIGNIIAPDTFKEAIKLFKSERTRMGGNFTLQFRLPIKDPNFNWMNLTDNKRNIMCSSNYISGITKDNINTKLPTSEGDNIGTYDDNYTLNPRIVGFDSIPGEVLLVPTNYPFYKGVGGKGGMCYNKIDSRPTWYGDKITGDIYSGDSKLIMVFKTTRPIVLLNLLDPVNIDWILGKLDLLKSEGRIDNEIFDGYKNALETALLNRTRHLKNIVGLENGKKRAIDSSLFSEYITYCNKKYGPKNLSGVVNRFSATWYDNEIPNILSLVLDGIYCDGYFADGIPSAGSIFPREIMLLNSIANMKIDFNNKLYTCPKKEHGKLKHKKTKHKKTKHKKTKHKKTKHKKN